MINNFVKKVSKNEKGMGTVEIVIIIAVLVGLALIFRKVMIQYVTTILTDVFNTNQDVSKNGVEESINQIINSSPTPGR